MVLDNRLKISFQSWIVASDILWDAYPQTECDKVTDMSFSVWPQGVGLKVCHPDWESLGHLGECFDQLEGDNGNNCVSKEPTPEEMFK